jgi:hypothetical protein
MSDKQKPQSYRIGDWAPVLVSFSKLERMTAWGSPVFAKGAADIKLQAEVALFVDITGHPRNAPSCDRCGKVDQCVDLVLKEQAPKGWASKCRVIFDALESSNRDRCLLCRGCYGQCDIESQSPSVPEAVGREVVMRAPAVAPVPRDQRAVSASTRPGDRHTIVISDKLAASLALTPAEWAEAMPLGNAFLVRVSPALGSLACIEVSGEQFVPMDASGARLSGDAPVMAKNIAIGACELLAHERGSGELRGDGDGAELPKKLVGPTRHIKVQSGADFRSIALSVLTGERSYELVFKDGVFVRGHWVSQRCGAGGRERKRVWRRPHWRGKPIGESVTYEIGAVSQ